MGGYFKMKTFKYKIVNTANDKCALMLVNDLEEMMIYVGSKQRCDIVLTDIQKGIRDIIGNKTLHERNVDVEEKIIKK
jgi:hypothetical protein